MVGQERTVEPGTPSPRSVSYRYLQLQSTVRVASRWDEVPLAPDGSLSLKLGSCWALRSAPLLRIVHTSPHPKQIVRILAQYLLPHIELINVTSLSLPRATKEQPPVSANSQERDASIWRYLPKTAHAVVKSVLSRGDRTSMFAAAHLPGVSHLLRLDGERLWRPLHCLRAFSSGLALHLQAE